MKKNKIISALFTIATMAAVHTLFFPHQKILEVTGDKISNKFFTLLIFIVALLLLLRFFNFLLNKIIPGIGFFMVSNHRSIFGMPRHEKKFKSLFQAHHWCTKNVVRKFEKSLHYHEKFQSLSSQMPLVLREFYLDESLKLLDSSVTNFYTVLTSSQRENFLSSSNDLFPTESKKILLRNLNSLFTKLNEALETNGKRTDTTTSLKINILLDSCEKIIKEKSF
jgi:hypothetical protein